MPEVYSNLSETAVAVGGYTSGSGLLNVVSTAAPFPTTGSFRVVLRNGALIPGTSVNAPKTILRVTAVNSATQWAVSVEQDDDSAVAGTVVVGVITAAAWNAIRSDQCQVAAFASLPNPATGKTGDQFRPSDGFAEYVLQAGVWVPFFNGVQIVKPVLGSFTWINQLDATAAQSGDALILKCPVNAGPNARIFAQTVAAPFTVTVLYMANKWLTQFSMNGLVAHDTISGGWVGHMLDYNSNQLEIVSGSDLTSGFAHTNPVLAVPQYVWSRIVDDGVNITFYYSADGRNWNLMRQQSRTAAPLTNGANRVGIVLGAPDTLPENWNTLLSFQLT